MKPPKKVLYRKFMNQFNGKACARCTFYQEGEGHHITYKAQSGYMQLVALNVIPLCHEHHMVAHDSKLKFFEWMDWAMPGRLEQLNDIRIELTNSRLSHEDIYDKYGTK